MLTNNYFNLKTYLESHALTTNSTSTADCGLLNFSGNRITLQVGFGSMGSVYGPAYNWALKMPTMMGAVVGSGTTQETKNDYCLENDITSSFSNFISTFTTTADGNSEKTIAIISGMNNTGSIQYISEVGVYKTIYYNPAYNEDRVLYARLVLTEPVIVHSGETFNLTYEWEEV